MRPLSSRLFLTALLFALITSPGFAGSYIAVPDADLIRTADAIAIVTIQSSHSYYADDGTIATDHVAKVERVLKAAPSPGSTIVLTQRGGIVGDIGYGVSTEPAFMTGERTLLMMRRLGVNRFATWSGELGKFNFVTDARSRELLVQEAGPEEVFGWDFAAKRELEQSRDASAFLRYIERIVAGEAAVADYHVQGVIWPIRPESHVAANDYSTLAGSDGIRWHSQAFSMQSTNTQTGVGDLTGSINSARGLWNDDPNSTINIGYSGGGGSGMYEEPSGPDFQNLLFFDQTDTRWPQLAGNVVGQANYWFTGSTHHSYNGSPFRNILDCDIIIEVGLTGNLFIKVLAHEKGHCLGCRHANQPGAGQTTNTTDAIMNSSVSGSGAPSLRPWDQDAASHMYGSGGSSCTPPSISTHPANVTITQGNSTTLTVVATGTTPLTYQWYIGTSPDTSSPTGTNSPSLTVSPSSTTSYWVRVTGQCAPAADSRTATVTVNPPTCTPPSINTHPENTTITQGNQATLTVVAAGTAPLSYQWYIGTSGNTSSPTGTNSASLNVSPSSTTSYWVRVTGQCAPAADSRTATVTVNAGTCTPPSITTQPQNKTITQGQAANLFVGATGTSPLSYQWFFGISGDTSNPVSGQTNPTLTHVPSTTTMYWVRVTGQCSPVANSQAATVTVNPGTCTPPSINVHPLSQTITEGTSVTLSVGVTGTAPFLFKWFQGTPPNQSNQVGSNSTLTVSPSSTTSYWVQVIGQCDPAANSNAATITVTSCQLPAITTEPQDQSIATGASATLSVAATNATTITWYRGAAGDKSAQVGAGNSFNTGPLTQTTQFWANLTNTCGEKASRTATVNVGTACTAPQITSTSPPQTKLKNETVTLNVMATGTPALQYQWYEGGQGDISNPVGIDSATFTSSPLTQTTRFWVKVTNACGSAFSSAIQVNVMKPRSRAVRH